MSFLCEAEILQIVYFFLNSVI